MKERDGKTKINHVTVFERPGLREFLKQVSSFADLVLFTAGLEGLSLANGFKHILLDSFFFALPQILKVVYSLGFCRLCESSS